ncbi:hypothetical protein CN601_04825 [Bacillus sp. AFS017336]|nr:hypothetical protein CN601_04825 [Bacillus sp. AFS017336]
MKKSYIFIFLMFIILIGSLKIPSILESAYPLDKEDMGQAFYNIKYLVQNLFYLVFIIFINIFLLICFYKNKK